MRFGNCFPDITASNVARVGALLSGIPDTVPGITVNRVCTSGMACLHDATVAIGAGLQDVVLVGGTENMSMQPYVLPAVRWGARCVPRSSCAGWGMYDGQAVRSGTSSFNLKPRNHK